MGQGYEHLQAQVQRIRCDDDAALKFTGISTATGPKNESQDCSFAVYSSKELDRKVRVLSKPEPEYDQQELPMSAPGAIVLRAIFCGSGIITDIKLQHGLSESLDEKAVEVARKIRFIPVEKDGQKVS